MPLEFALCCVSVLTAECSELLLGGHAAHCTDYCSSLPTGNTFDWFCALEPRAASTSSPTGPRYQLAEQLLVISCLAGCEFFKEYKDRDYTAEGLIFNWKQVQNGELWALLTSQALVVLFFSNPVVVFFLSNYLFVLGLCRCSIKYPSVCDPISQY